LRGRGCALYAKHLRGVRASDASHFRRSDVFENIRKSLSDLLDKATPPEERRIIASRMKATLIQARASVDELRTGLDRSRQRLLAEERELDTVRRRKGLAAGIGDRETVLIAEKYEVMYAERVDVIRRKVDVQESELRLAEREVEEMTVEFKAAVDGAIASPSPGDAGVDRERAGEDLEGLARARSRADRDAEAQRKLDELKRRMGK
jgi:hypothetical protein